MRRFLCLLLVCLSPAAMSQPASPAAAPAAHAGACEATAAQMAHRCCRPSPARPYRAFLCEQAEAGEANFALNESIVLLNGRLAAGERRELLQTRRAMRRERAAALAALRAARAQADYEQRVESFVMLLYRHQNELVYRYVH